MAQKCRFSQGIYSMWDGIPKIKIHMCVCIEARDDAEMNETALGACRATHLHRIDDPFC